jgi:trehalose-6-phosphate hydrolase
LIALRKQLPVITDGSYVDLFPEHPQVHGYLRENEEGMLLCLNNYYGDNTYLELPERFDGLSGSAVLSNLNREGEVTVDEAIELNGYETLAILIEK